MSSDYYVHGSYPATGAAGRSSDARAEFDAVATGFAKLPGLVGNAFKISYVNAGATAWDTLGGTGLLKLRAAAVPVIAADGTDYVSPAGAAILTNKTIVVASNTITTSAHGTLAATELNAALAELADDDAFIAAALGAHLIDAVDAHMASAIGNTPAGGIAATTVQGALNELDTEKAPLASPTFTGNPLAPTPTLGDDDTSIATTGFVMDAFANGFGGAAFGFKNKMINGTPDVWQRGVGPFTGSAASEPYTADRWRWSQVGGGAGVVTLDQTTNVPTIAQGATRLFNFSLRVDVTTADAAIGAAEAYGVLHKMEGYDWAALAQRPCVLSFWFRTERAGTYCASLRNTAADRSFVGEFTHAGGGAWEFKQIPVPASPSAGTWNYTTGIGIQIHFTLAAGTNFHTTAGAWQTGNFLATVNQVNAMGLATDDVRITGVQLEAGTEATPTETRPFATELAMCQRYYEKSFAYATAPAQNAGTVGALRFIAGKAGANAEFGFSYYVVRKRAAPTVTLFNPSAANGQVRDSSAAADCSAAVGSSVETALYISATGNAATAVGNALDIQWTADAEL